jgi:tetratricopeptide (TPR) repeat protein
MHIPMVSSYTTSSQKPQASRFRPYLRSLRSLASAILLFSTLCVAQQSGDFESIVAAAAAARSQGDAASAVRLYTQAVSLNPQWLDGWWFLGTLEYGANQFAAARDALTRYIELKPNAGAALALRGLCEFETSQYAEALADIQHGITLGAAAQPRNAEILYYHEGLLMTRLGYFEEALSQFANLVKGGKSDPELTTAIGLATLRMPVLPQDADPAQSELLAMTGTAAAKVMNADLDGARQSFAELFTRYPKTPNIHYTYGYLLFATHPEDAIAQFQQELTLSPDSAVTNAMLAWAYGIQGSYPDALPLAKKAVALDPSLVMGQMVLGKAMIETGSTAAALPHIEKVLQSEPGNLEAHIALATAYSKLGRKGDARRERLLSLQLSNGDQQPSATP